MDSGLYIPHAVPNLFGPMPKSECPAVTPRVTDMVDEKEGPISVLFISRRFGITFPTNCPDKKNKRDIITITKEIVGKCFFSLSSVFDRKVVEVL